MKQRLLITAAAIALTSTAGLVHAQSGSISAVDLTGRWTLDTYLSDNPGQVAAAIRIDLGQGLGEEPFAGEPDGVRIGGPAPRDPGRRRQPGPESGESGRSRDNALSAEEQKRLDGLLDAVRYPPLMLAITQSSSAITFADSLGPSRTSPLNGKREKQPLGSGTVDCTTRQEGPQVVSECDLGKGRKLIYTYSLVPTTKQLLVRITIERLKGLPGPIEIKQVYNRVPG